MAVTQYIGARYVPLFYVNTVDGTNTWEAGVQYDPLTIVTYLNQSYTSKIPVPSSVGNPADNPTYWVITGGYNSQVAQLQQDVDDLTLQYGVIAPEVAELYGRKRTFVLLGDSYEYGIDGDNPTQQVTGGGWGARCQTMLEAMGHTVYRLVTPLGGAIGFAAARTYLSILQWLEANTIPDPDAITDIVILGGTNDESPIAAVPAAISTLMTYIRSTFPNADVAVGTIGTRARTLHSVIEPAYRTINNYGGAFIGDLANLLCQYSLIGTDNLHLTESGYAAISPYVTNAILTGHCTYDLEATMTITPNTAAVNFAGSSPTVHYRVSPDTITVWIDVTGDPAITFVNTPTINIQNFTIASLAFDQMFLNPYYAFAQDFLYDIYPSPYVLYPKSPAMWYVNANELHLYVYGSFSTAAYNNARAYVPKVPCAQ